MGEGEAKVTTAPPPLVLQKPAAAPVGGASKAQPVGLPKSADQVAEERLGELLGIKNKETLHQIYTKLKDKSKDGLTLDEWNETMEYFGLHGAKMTSASFSAILCGVEDHWYKSTAVSYDLTGGISRAFNTCLAFQVIGEGNVGKTFVVYAGSKDIFIIRGEKQIEAVKKAYGSNFTEAAKSVRGMLTSYGQTKFDEDIPGDKTEEEKWEILTYKYFLPTVLASVGHEKEKTWIEVVNQLFKELEEDKTVYARYSNEVSRFKNTQIFNYKRVLKGTGADIKTGEPGGGKS